LVRESLDALWSVGNVVLYTWMSFLQNDMLDALNVCSPLTVDQAESLAAILDHDATVYKQVGMHQRRHNILHYLSRLNYLISEQRQRDCVNKTVIVQRNILNCIVLQLLHSMLCI